MTPTTSEREARELLAREYEAAGLAYDADRVRSGALPHSIEIRAIIAALTREQRENDAIAAAFREVTGPNGASISNDEIADYITQRSKEIMANAPQQEAQGAVASLPVDVRGAWYDVPIPVQVYVTSLRMQLERNFAGVPAFRYIHDSMQHCVSAAGEGEDYAVSREMLDALTTLGLMEKVGRGKWSPTEAGEKLAALDDTTPPAPVDVRMLREIVTLIDTEPSEAQLRLLALLDGQPAVVQQPWVCGFCRRTYYQNALCCDEQRKFRERAQAALGGGGGRG